MIDPSLGPPPLAYDVAPSKNALADDPLPAESVISPSPRRLAPTKRLANASPPSDPPVAKASEKLAASTTPVDRESPRSRDLKEGCAPASGSISIADKPLFTAANDQAARSLLPATRAQSPTHTYLYLHMSTNEPNQGAAPLTLLSNDTPVFRRNDHSSRRSEAPHLIFNTGINTGTASLGWQACTRFMEFLLASQTPDDVLHRAAAGLGILSQVERVEVRDHPPLHDDLPSAFFSHGPNHNQTGPGRWLVVKCKKSPLTRIGGEPETNAMLAALLQLCQQVHERELMRATLLGEALTDPLTGLLNRRGFLRQLDQALARQARHGETVTLLLLDVDYFKQINDVHGHAIGDAALASVAQAMRDVVRPSDVAARLGGDELALLLSNCDEEGGLVVAQRLQSAALHRNPLSDRDLTLSIGVAQADMVAANVSEEQARMSLMAAADEALYAAKRSGRACARAYGSEPDTLVDLSDLIFELDVPDENPPRAS